MMSIPIARVSLVFRVVFRVFREISRPGWRWSPRRIPNLPTSEDLYHHGIVGGGLSGTVRRKQAMVFPDPLYVERLVKRLEASGNRTCLRHNGRDIAAGDFLNSIHRYARPLDSLSVGHGVSKYLFSRAVHANCVSARIRASSVLSQSPAESREVRKSVCEVHQGIPQPTTTGCRVPSPYPHWR
jgi:hypothetical protein